MVHVIGTYLPRMLRHVIWDPLWKMPSQGKNLYLTFDDGPDEVATPQLLEILDRHQASATFFLRGDHAEQRPQMVRDMLSAGHAIGNHTYSHANAWKVSSDEYKAELERATDILQQLTGEPIRWMRPPFGRITPAALTWCKHAGQKLVMWDVLPGDFTPTATAAHVAQWTHNRIRPGSIVCLHDNPKSRSVTPAAMAELLPQLQDDGWQLCALPAVRESIPAIREGEL
ncbi:polysaccharide deacetylase family protein [Symmachiella dynata]|uniref:polysaccharide deacetylase family protein n=1 Tax=Symmachiella dynata TaxID=2527995 RepID=UPI0030EF219A